MSSVDTEPFRALAADLDRIDVDVYAEHGRDPLEPIIGMGDRRCRLAIMGRDPGRHEVQYGEPFIGAGGQLVRRALFDALHPPGESSGPSFDFEESRAVGSTVFWANTVPYKPVGNKAWGVRCKRSFHPLMADVLVNHWDGEDLIALGRDAVMWFGLPDKAQMSRLKAFWEREDRYETHIEVALTAPGGAHRSLRVHPVPHPSPLNARWYRQVPDMLRRRLSSMEWGPESWRLPE